MRPSTERFAPASLERAAVVRFAVRRRPVPAPADVRAASGTLRRAANTFYRDPNPETAAALLEISLRHPRELVRVAAAASYLDVAAIPTLAIGILEHGVGSSDRLTRDVAATALAHVDPRNRALERLLVPRRRHSRRRPSQTSTIVHGTWGSMSSWWQPPTGNFWKYLQDTVDPALYGADDRFEWSGGYSDVARALAGDDLRQWVHQHNLEGLDLFTHSHGGSVAMLASHAGTRMGRLVLLSCPVHWPKYTPDFTRIDKIVSVRVHLDLVILADRGGQRFRDPRISEHVLPIWFDHFATQDPGTWEQYRVQSML
jgi:pimeloyl-ACP methyl ester carboxylesterase